MCKADKDGIYRSDPIFLDYLFKVYISLFLLFISTPVNFCLYNIGLYNLPQSTIYTYQIQEITRNANVCAGPWKWMKTLSVVIVPYCGDGSQSSTEVMKLKFGFHLFHFALCRLTIFFFFLPSAPSSCIDTSAALSLPTPPPNTSGKLTSVHFSLWQSTTVLRNHLTAAGLIATLSPLILKGDATSFRHKMRVLCLKQGKLPVKVNLLVRMWMWEVDVGIWTISACAQ